MRRYIRKLVAPISATSALLLLTMPYASAASADSVAAPTVLRGADFNCDFYADLAIGVPNEDQAASNDGAVNVIYGSPAGLTASGNQVWSQDSAGIAGGNEAGDVFGHVVAAGDFNGDWCSDLAIGVPLEDQAGTNDGAVNVIYGSPSGLTAAGNQVWSQDSPGILGGNEAGDQFGQALATGDLNGDGYADLAVGVPNEDQAGSDDGAVNVIYGSAGGLTAAGNQVWSQDSAGIVGGSEAGDQFGGSVAIGNFGAGGFDDLAIGVPYEDQAATNDGAVNVIYGSAGGLTAAGNQVWSQDSAGIGGGSEAGDLFGVALAAGDFNRNGYVDLAIGVPDEDQSAADDGAVNVIYSSAGGLTAAGNQVWSQDSAGIGGVREAADAFGLTLVAADLGGDSATDLAIGVPYEDQAAANDGAVNVIYGSPSGLNQAGNQVWSQDSAGIGGGSEANDLFGDSLAAADFGKGGAKADLVIGVPLEDQAGVNDGAANVIYGAAGGLNQAGNQVWSQDSAGIGGGSEAGDAFGSSVAPS